MKQRLVILGIDDICRLFADYAAQTGFPSDAKADALLRHPVSNRMRLRVVADSLTGNQPPEEIRFDLKRTHMVNLSGQ